MRKSLKVFVTILIVGVVFSFLAMPMAAGAAAGNTTAAVRTNATVNGKKGTPTENYTVEGISYKEESLKIFELINKEREKEDLAPLAWNEASYNVAMQRAFEISAHFAHERPDGSALNTLDYLNGENLGTGTDGSAADVMKAWMKSPGHRKNILRTEYTSVSVATVKIDGTWYWVQIFTVDATV